MATLGNPDAPETFQQAWTRIEQENTVYNEHMQNPDNAPPGNDFGMYTYNFSYRTWHCEPCGKFVGLGAPEIVQAH